MLLPRVAFAFALTLASGVAQQSPAAESANAINERIAKLRSLPDEERAKVTRQLAFEIRQLPSRSKLGLASSLANLSTEGDFGRDTLQEVTTTLEQALRESPALSRDSSPDPSYVELAQLERYEHMRVTLDDPQYQAAFAQLEAEDRDRGVAEFTLSDLTGTKWNLKSLRGNVVLVNFWATWCPPCRKEMPDLDTLYARFKNQGLVILAISDEGVNTVTSFLRDKQPVSYPVLLDPGRATTKRFHVEGIPKTFVYDRDGTLVAQSIDMRTMNQFLEMLQRAGIQ
jgi:peroxiredoxin